MNHSNNTQDLPPLDDKNTRTNLSEDQKINKSGKTNRELMAEFFAINQEAEKK